VPDWAALAGPVTHRRDAQSVFATESLAQALRRLEIYGRDGLPVLSADGKQVEGWVTSASVLRAIARQVGTSRAEAAQGQIAADQDHIGEASLLRRPPAPQAGYQVIELRVGDGSPAVGARLDTIGWPRGTVPVSVLRDHRYQDADPTFTLRAGDGISMLAPAALLPACSPSTAVPMRDGSESRAQP
jgi:CIC family chloride channel protein